VRNSMRWSDGDWKHIWVLECMEKVRMSANNCCMLHLYFLCLCVIGIQSICLCLGIRGGYRNKVFDVIEEDLCECVGSCISLSINWPGPRYNTR